MDYQNFTTESAEHKKGQYFPCEGRGGVHPLKHQGYSNKAIAIEIDRSPWPIIFGKIRRHEEAVGTFRTPDRYGL